MAPLERSTSSSCSSLSETPSATRPARNADSVDDSLPHLRVALLVLPPDDPLCQLSQSPSLLAPSSDQKPESTRVTLWDRTDFSLADRCSAGVWILDSDLFYSPITNNLMGIFYAPFRHTSNFNIDVVSFCP